MKHPPKHSHLEPALAVLRDRGAVLKSVGVQRHIAVQYEFGHCIREVRMPASPRDPALCAAKVCEGLKRQLGETARCRVARQRRVG